MERSNRGLPVVLGVLVLALLIGPVLMGTWMAAGVVGPGMMGWGVTGGTAATVNGWPWGLRLALGGLMMVAFWGALIVGVVVLVRWGTGQRTNRIDSEDPLTILRRRYAAGDIGQPTFQRMSSELGGPASGARQPATANGRTEVLR